MTQNGLEAARQERNFFERLMARIPGFSGFSERETRREVDKTQREYLATELGRLKAKSREMAREFTDAGDIASLGNFDRLDRRLDGLSQSIRFADYGQSGLFAVDKIGEAELERVYQFDLEFLDDIARLEGDLGTVPLPGSGDAKTALAAILRQLQELTDKWNRRETVLSDVIKTAR